MKLSNTEDLWGFFFFSRICWAFVLCLILCNFFFIVMNPKIVWHRQFDIKTLGFKIYVCDSVTEWGEWFRKSQLGSWNLFSFVKKRNIKPPLIYFRNSKWGIYWNTHTHTHILNSCNLLLSLKYRSERREKR